MNENAFAPVLLFASLGMALSFRERRAIVAGIAAAVVAGIAGGSFHAGADWVPIAAAGCWIGVVAATASMHLPRRVAAYVVVPLCAVGGVCAGIAGGSIASGAIDLGYALPGLLLCVPGAWLVRSGRGVFVTVAASWLAAAAILSVGLGMTPTLGYEADHRE